MARAEARLLTAIWTDPDFIALSPAAQRMYVLLISQAPLTFAGTIAITLRRWAAYSPGTSIEDVEKALTELEAHPFVVIDWDTEELLVRSFVKNDGVYKQPNLMVTAAKDAEAIASLKLRAALCQELRSLPLTEEDKAKTTTRGKTPLPTVITEMIETLSRGLRSASDNPSGNPNGKAIDNPSENPNGKGLGDRGTLRTERIPQSPVPEPQSPDPSPQSPGSSRAHMREEPPPTMLGSTLLDEHVKALARRPPRDVHRQLGERIDRLLDEKFDSDVIRKALGILREKPHLGPGVLPSLVNQVINAAPSGRYSNDQWNENTEIVI